MRIFLTITIHQYLQAQEEAPTTIDGTIKGLTPVSALFTYCTITIVSNA